MRSKSPWAVAQAEWRRGCIPLVALLVVWLGQAAALTTMTRAGDQETYLNRPSYTLVYKLTSNDTALQNIDLLVAVGNASMVPPQNIVRSRWSASMRTIILFPAPNVLGTTNVTVTATDGALVRVTDSFNFTIRPSTFGGVEADVARTDRLNTTCTVDVGVTSSIYVKCLDVCIFDWPKAEFNIIEGARTPTLPAQEQNPFAYFPLCNPYTGGLAVPTNITAGKFVGCSLYSHPAARPCTPELQQSFLSPVGTQFSSYAGCVTISDDECVIWTSCSLSCCNATCKATYCTPRTTCSGNGQCNADGSCLCDSTWFGANCSTFCNASTTCSGNGYCNPSDGACVCTRGWRGTDCSTPPAAVTVQGFVYNAATFVGVGSATVQLVEAATGLLATSTSTDSQGAFQIAPFRYAPGAYHAIGTRTGFIPVNITVTIPAYLSDTAVLSPLLVLYMSTNLGPNEFRVVLSWQSGPPEDLDAHLVMPSTFPCASCPRGPGEPLYELHWACESGRTCVNGDMIASLDVDNIMRSTTRKPETVTFSAPGTLPSERPNGTFSYWVHQTDHCVWNGGEPYCFPGYAHEAATAMRSAGVEVTLYTQSATVRWSFPAAGEGYWWHVFDLDGPSFLPTTVNYVGPRTSPVVVPTACPSGGYDYGSDSGCSGLVP